MDNETTTSTHRRLGRGAKRFLGWGVRRLAGPLGMFAVLFGLVYASAGTNGATIDGAQPIDYHEECNAEGCSREEVKELWSTFHHECFVEKCWMEEVGEDAGSDIAQKLGGDTWYFKNPQRVAQMIDYFVNRLGHREAMDVRMKPGPTNTLLDRLIRAVLNKGRLGLDCTWVHNGRRFDCEGKLGQ